MGQEESIHMTQDGFEALQPSLEEDLINFTPSPRQQGRWVKDFQSIEGKQNSKILPFVFHCPVDYPVASFLLLGI
ncbi:hypothetical protein CEXT_800001 [Caerostris extrusa]|uniref:Uncharacterized protein n=1 Tax=Caerostris extrusa TaxID=172846 RepID=A0AAV4RIS1_CAEEX|nr:hypothetical protein CEXT_800001 [Caerostris extrusa]